MISAPSGRVAKHNAIQKKLKTKSQFNSDSGYWILETNTHADTEETLNFQNHTEKRKTIKNEDFKSL